LKRHPLNDFFHLFVSHSQAAEKARNKLFTQANKLQKSRSSTAAELIIDVSLPLASSDPDLFTGLTDTMAEFDCPVETFAPPPPLADRHLIRWRRKQTKTYDGDSQVWIPNEGGEVRLIEESTILLFMRANEVEDLVWNKRLVQVVDSLRQHYGPSRQLMVMTDGLVRWARREKNSASRSFADSVRTTLNGGSGGGGAASSERGPMAERVEDELLRMSVAERCHVVRVEGTEEAVEWLRNLTMDISNRPYKYVRDRDASLFRFSHVLVAPSC
jgi:hypothetical protein